MWKRIVAPILVVFFSVSSPLWAEVVRPDDRVINGVVIRSQPTTQSSALGLLRPGEELPYRGAMPRWNVVELVNGETAYVSKAWTKVVSESTGAEFTVHAVDVGTGLAIVVQGSDFTLVYDGGSNDDRALGNRNRLAAYLKKVAPSLNRINHLILSHAHRDHVELIPDLFDEYEVRHVWDSGRHHTICGYRAFLRKVSEEPNVSYHTAVSNFGNFQASFASKTCYGNNLPSETIEIECDSRINDASVELGAGAYMTFLYADAAQHSSLNENSLVVRLDLGQTRLLLPGDAEAGGRRSPQTHPSEHSIEGNLLECCSEALRANILVVAHHGSISSSRTAFLDAVGASTFIISSGPTRYGSVTLPDAEIITELENRGTVYRTDLNDSSCRTNNAKIGTDNDGKPGGCDNIRIAILSDGSHTTDYWSHPD